MTVSCVLSPPRGATLGLRPIFHHKPIRAEGHTPVLQREALGPGSSLNGSAIVEQLDTTTVLPPGVHTETDDSGNLSIDVPAM